MNDRIAHASASTDDFHFLDDRPHPFLPGNLQRVGRSAPDCAASHPWLKLESAEVTIYSDTSPKEVIECAVQYSGFRRVLDALFTQPGQSLPPSVVILFRSHAEFDDYTAIASEANRTPINFNTEVDGTPYSTFAPRGDISQALAFTFEFETIWSLRQLGYFVPVWASQGTGEVLSELVVRPGKCLVGTQDEHSSETTFPWPEFFQIGEGSPSYKDPKQLHDYLSQAWGLMHWILLKDNATHERFAALADRLHDTSSLAAVEAVMNTPADQFERAIDEHLWHFRKPREIDFDEAALRASLHVTAAPEAEVLAQTANLLAASNQTAKCDRQLDRARELAPHLPVVLDAWARRMLREGRADEALNLYRAAIAAGTKNFYAYITSATSHLNDDMTGNQDLAGQGSDQATIALAETRQAIKLNPGSVVTYRLLGRALFVAPKITDRDVAELSQGVVPGEDGTVVRYYRALLYARLGQIDKSRADLQRVASDPDTSDNIRRAATDRLARK